MLPGMRPNLEILRSFGPLGWTSFGGPAAHLGYFREEFVHRRGWVGENAYAALVSMSQFLPGPASSKVGMALGYHRGGLAGMGLSWLLFTLPSALLMALAGLAYHLGDAPGIIAGLLAAAVAVVARAVIGMAGKLLRTGFGWAIAAVTALVLILAGTSWQLPMLALAAILGATILRGRLCYEAADASKETPLRAVSARLGVGSLAAFGGLLVVLPILAQVIGGYFWERASAFYSSGALVFGGGHVVLPLLEERFVNTGWVTQAEFLAGYSAAQAVPGPMFTFASYLGAVDGGIGGAVLATVFIFLPGALLTLAALYFWSRWRQVEWLHNALGAVNAAVIGLLVAAWWDPILTHGITGWATGLLAVVVFALLQWTKTPAWAIALGAAIMGGLFL